jgi:hypothetical protein
VPVFVERANQVRHRAQVGLIGRPRHFLHILEAQELGILSESHDVLVRVRAQVGPSFQGAGNRAVVDVGEVHHLAHAIAQQVSQRAPKHVDADERPEVADVTPRVHRQAARVHPHGAVG